jgi:hypothetical protein
MKSTYSVLSNTEFLDALELATECVQLWDAYLRALKGSNKQVNTNTSG